MFAEQHKISIDTLIQKHPDIIIRNVKYGTNVYINSVFPIR